MKFSSFSTIILLTFSSILFIPPIQCTLPTPSLVDQICQKTPNSHLCIMTLKSQSSSHHLTSSADIAGFVRITLGVLEAKAPAILDQLQKVYGQTSNHPSLKIARNVCVTSYTRISKELLPQAQNCLDKGDYDGVKHGAYVIGNLAASCEKRCNSTTSSGSPLRDSNQYVQDICAITVSIVTKLAQAKHQTLT